MLHRAPQLPKALSDQGEGERHPGPWRGGRHRWAPDPRQDRIHAQGQGLPQQDPAPEDSRAHLEEGVSDAGQGQARVPSPLRPGLIP